MLTLARLAAVVLALVTLAGCTSTLPVESTSPQRRAVLDAVQTFFDSMQARDVEASERVLIPEGVFISVRHIDGVQTLRSFTNASYIAGLRESDEPLRETMQDPVVLIDSDVAVVWTDYRFERSSAVHTGKDAFNLVRTDGRWKIAGGVYSVIPLDDSPPR